MPSIQELAVTESEIFRGGSGAGVNLSTLREDGARLTNGGTSSGPVSFMRWLDAGAGAIKSGGGTRRAAKMVILNDDHPDILEFIRCKANEERKAYALGDAGWDLSLTGEAWSSIQFQNANNTVRAADAFLEAVEADATWELRSVATGETVKTVPAREMMREIAQAAWECGDPGMQYDTTIQRWHPNPSAGPITTTNPCSEITHLDNSACNLAALNLPRFLGDGGGFDVQGFRHAVDVMLCAQDILVTPASYPTRKIGDNARRYRQLGLNFTGLGELLMSMGLAYDSDEGRMIAGSVVALMHARAYHASGRLAERLGAYDGFAADADTHVKVVERHRAEATMRLVATDLTQEEIIEAARCDFREAVALGASVGYRNAQVTCSAPTGTISFMLDAATTGCEPAMALVSYKSLVGGGHVTLTLGCVDRALRTLGYSEPERDAITTHISAHQTLAGSSIRPEHLPVFQTAIGDDAIAPDGHVLMVAAIQPYLSGAVSKTVNLPNNATVTDIEAIYMKAWRLGLKAIAVYRDGSKRTQPVSTTQDAGDGAAQTPKPLRRKLPGTRDSRTHKFDIGGEEGYITTSTYGDGTPGEVFIKISKQGSTVSGLADSFAMAMSIALQYGVPLEQLVRMFLSHRFAPEGITANPAIRVTSSLVDYLVRHLAGEFLPPDQAEAVGVNIAELPGRSDPPRQRTHAPGADDDLTTLRLSDGGTCSCGGLLLRTGACKTCSSCGANTGCG